MKIVKKEDIVGTYEDITVVHCKNCEESIIHISKYVTEYTELNQYGPWICPSCKHEDYYPKSYVAKKFICPDCTKENIQPLEPSLVKIEKAEDSIIKYHVFNNTEVVCMECLTSFYVALLTTEDNQDPNSWERTLYRISNE